MYKWKIGIQPSVVVYVNFTKGVFMYSCVFKHLPMVLAWNVIYYFLAVEGRCQDGTVKKEDFSEVLLIDHQKWLDLFPSVHDEFVSK